MQIGKTLDIIDRQMSVGQVKTIRTGNYLDYVELLFSDTTKSQMAPTDDKKMVQLVFSDNIIDMPNTNCTMSKKTLYDYILALKTIYNQLLDEEEN